MYCTHETFLDCSMFYSSALIDWDDSGRDRLENAKFIGKTKVTIIRGKNRFDNNSGHFLVLDRRVSSCMKNEISGRPFRGKQLCPYIRNFPSTCLLWNMFERINKRDGWAYKLINIINAGRISDSLIVLHHGNFLKTQGTTMFAEINTHPK